MQTPDESPQSLVLDMRMPIFHLLVACALAVAASSISHAHETDQFTLPEGREFADIGRYLNEWAYAAIERGVSKVNRRAVQGSFTASSRPTPLQIQEEIVRAVNAEFGNAYDVIEGLEKALYSRQLKQRYPGKLVGYKQQFGNIYQHVHFPLDPRQFFRIWHASTFVAYGTYVGTDKIGHFTDMGMNYYRAYIAAIKRGESVEAARRAAIKVGTEGALFGEKGMVGYLSAGDYSNSDLAANYLGFLFYLNLTDMVRLKGRTQPPMLIREGDQWTIAPHVRRDSDFFAHFISDHLDEGVNPGHFEEGMREALRKAVKERASAILNRRCDHHGNRRTKAYFDAVLSDMRTYYGDEYGYHGTYNEFISIGNTCFERFSDDANPAARNAFGYTPLHDAAARGDLEQVKRLLLRGADVNARVRSQERYSPEWGNTPLHEAARDGRMEVAEHLLAHGALINAQNARGITPLHRALAYPDLAKLLIDRGADVNLASTLGESPLFWAAADGQSTSVELLLSRGANPRARNSAGLSPLHMAARYGNTEAALKLIAAGADVNALSNLAATPLHMAAAGRHTAMVDLLMQSGGDIRAPDQFGWTPLHDAASASDDEAVALLLSRGADASVRNVHLNTPLHLAARHNRDVIITALVQRGAPLNAQNASGMTPMHEAAMTGHRDAVAALLQSGADRMIRNAQGLTPLQIASSNGFTQIVELLRNHGQQAAADHSSSPASSAMGVKR